MNYLTSYSVGPSHCARLTDQFYTIATVIASRSTNMATLIAMRAISAIGSAAVFSIGAGTLAEMFDPHERGQKVRLVSWHDLTGSSASTMVPA